MPLASFFIVPALESVLLFEVTFFILFRMANVYFKVICSSHHLRVFFDIVYVMTSTSVILAFLLCRVTPFV